MTGLMARRAWPKGHDDGSDVVTSLGTKSAARALLSFQGPHRARSKGLFEQPRLAPKAANKYIGRRSPPTLAKRVGRQGRWAV